MSEYRYLYQVWCPDLGQECDLDAKVIRAESAGNAAEAWAEWSDWTSAEYRIANGREATVHVKGTGGIFIFNVFAETRPTYYAILKK